MPRLKPPEHIQQKAWGYCLPACVQMALSQFDISISQEKLASLLGVRPGIGTSFSQVRRLKQVKVMVTEWGSIDAVVKALGEETAVIAALKTSSGLPGWPDLQVQHTVLVGEITAHTVVYYDPALDEGPVAAPLNEFLLAWSEMSELAAFLSVK
jgi:ABC-type bacteriocin/lantibiotic exporter with double-glycine peptidase domain